MKHLRWTRLFFVFSLVFWSFGCPTDDDGDDSDVVSYEVELAGENQDPPVATPADGNVEVELENDTLTIEGEFENLVSRLHEFEGSSIHIYESAVDGEDAILFSADVDANDDERSGTFEFNEELDGDQVQAFRSGEYFINIHTQAYQRGELGAPLSTTAPEFAGIDQSWGVELSPGAQPHSVDTDANGWMWAVLRDDETFVVSGAFQELSSDLADVEGGPINIHQAEFGETGDVVFNLNYQLFSEIDDDSFFDFVEEEIVEDGENAGRFWYQTVLSDDEADDLQNGEFYVNIFTSDFLEGELRGQFDDDTGFFVDIWEDIFGGEQDEIEEAPPF